MARSKSLNLTEAELRLMQILWDSGPATVTEVARALPRRLSLAYNTVLTTLRILEQKGYVTHDKRGRAHVYAPLVDREAAQRSAVRHLLSRFFDGSPGLLVMNLLEDEKLDAAELERLKRLIAEEESDS
jgi:predicted transcriptional regulator